MIRLNLSPRTSAFLSITPRKWGKAPIIYIIANTKSWKTSPPPFEKLPLSNKIWNYPKNGNSPKSWKNSPPPGGGNSGRIYTPAEQRNIIKKLQEKVVNLEFELSTAIADCNSARKRQDAAERLASGLQIEVKQLRSELNNQNNVSLRSEVIEQQLLESSPRI